MRHDYLAELFVAGVLADGGWNVYFPHRDEGFDFIVSKHVGGQIILRPVQVKGKYPMNEKTNKISYGYIGRLTAIHSEMVLAIPYFSSRPLSQTPVHVAYMPFGLVRPNKRGFRCLPAGFIDGQPQPKRDFRQFFDEEGIHLLESKDWSQKISVLQ